MKRGNTKVSNLDKSVLEQHDILRLDIPVDYTLAVRMSKCFCDLNAEIQHFIGTQHTGFFHILLERYPVNELHYNILCFFIMADIINRHNIRMRKHCNRLRFGSEAFSEIFVGGCVVVHDLNRIIAVQPMAQCLIHIGHAACSDEFKYLVPVIEYLTYIFISTFFHISTYRYQILTSTIETLSLAPLSKARFSKDSHIFSGVL